MGANGFLSAAAPTPLAHSAAPPSVPSVPSLKNVERRTFSRKFMLAPPTLAAAANGLDGSNADSPFASNGAPSPPPGGCSGGGDGG
jgi:hypothetical protein